MDVWRGLFYGSGLISLLLDGGLWKGGGGTNTFRPITPRQAIEGIAVAIAATRVVGSQVWVVR